MPGSTTSTPSTVALTQSPSARAIWMRRIGVVALLAALAGAIFVRRSTITDAIGEIGKLPLVAVAGLVALAAYERWSRADITARLLGPLRTRHGFVVHDVGNAVSKGVPMGGALGTAVRWSIVRRHEVSSVRFATMLVAYGVATTLVTWVLPLGALLVDLVGRRMTATDGILVLVLTLGIIAQVGFWFVVLGNDRVERIASRFTANIWRRAAARLTVLRNHDAEGMVVEVRRELRTEARRALPLLLRTGLAQACGAVILFVALRSLGVGSELGATEFFRLFFLTHLLGTFAPTPGGVGVVEAGMSGALVAAGVAPTAALAGVLVYRFLTYVLPICVGTALYLVWRRAAAPAVDSATATTSAIGSAHPPVRDGAAEPTTLAAHGASIGADLPHVPRPANQGFRQRRNARRDDHARGVERRWAS
ncbi:MAG: YbhN family protein [Actinomycetota bacterium]